MDNDYLTTKEVAELLRIKERKVYDLAALEQIPCTRATGKLLFSRSAITQWLAQHSSGADAASRQAQMLFAGSHDPLLEWAIRESQCGIPVLFDGSVDGLDRVMRGDATVSGMHIYSPSTDRWNIDAVKQRIHQHSGSVVLVHWLTRQRGLMMKPGLGLSGLKDLATAKTDQNTDIALVVRQAGAGSQLLLQHLLSEVSIDVADLNIALTARSEADVALAITEGKADCGLGLASLAGQHQLDFVLLVEESFDLLVDRQFWFEPAMQKFITFCGSETFETKVQQSIGYEADKLLPVLFNS